MRKFTINIPERTVTVTSDKRTKDTLTEEVTLREHDIVSPIFLPGTEDTFECELLLLDVSTTDPMTMEVTGTETKAFLKRVGFDNWLMDFDPNQVVLTNQPKL